MGSGADPDSGLTRFSYHLMDQNVTITQLHHITAIPVPTLSMYANGHRSISANHRPVIAALLSLQPDELVGYCTTEIIIMTPTDTPTEPEDITPTPEPDEEPSHGDSTPDDTE